MTVIQPLLQKYNLDSTELVPYDLTNNTFSRIGAAAKIRQQYFPSGPIALESDRLIEVFYF